MSGWLIQVPVRRFWNGAHRASLCRVVPETPKLLQLSRSGSTRLRTARAAGRIVGRDIEGAGALARRRVSYPRQIVTRFTRRKPRHVRQTRSFWLAAFGMLILSHIAGAQPLGINPSAAPSDLGNPNSIIRPPAPRTFGIRAPSTQLRRRRRFLAAERDPWRRSTPGARPAPDHPAVACSTLDGTPRSGITARQLEERRKRETEPGWTSEQASTPGRSSGLTWQRAGPSRPTSRSSVVLRFMMSAVGGFEAHPSLEARRETGR